MPKLTPEQKIELLKFLVKDDSCDCQNCAMVYGVIMSDRFISFAYEAERLYKQMNDV